MIANHTIALDRLNEAMCLVVRGFGSHEDEVQAVAGNLIDANLTGYDPTESGCCRVRVMSMHSSKAG